MIFTVYNIINKKLNTLMELNQHTRFQKLFTDNIYLIKISKNKYDFTFKIAGSSTNIYTVKLINNQQNNHLFCDCYDMKKWAKEHGVFCKHILFVVFRVLKLFNYSNILSKITIDDTAILFFKNKTLNALHIEKVHSFVNTFNFSDISSSLFNIDYIKHYERLVSKQPLQHSSDKTIPTECVICFDGIKNVYDTSNCDQCIGCFHTSCFNTWLKFNKSCPLCRAPINYNKNDYLNLI